MTYRKLESIYGGPFCDVYRGVAQTGDAVALKVVDFDFLKQPHDFRKEIRLMKYLHHSNICEYIDDYSLGEDHYLVMPFYDKTLADLAEHFSKKKTVFDLENPQTLVTKKLNTFPLDSARAIVWGIVDAVRYLHQQGIIHRDIKPSNVFFKNIDTVLVPILGDFGISYDLNAPLVGEPLSEKFTDVATGYYKAPELCFGISDYGTEVDLWAFGILISGLYSLDGEPANKVAPDHENEKSPEINDFLLLQGTFEAFGTPHVSDRSNPLYCEALADPLRHFVDFKYVQHARKQTEVLLPRCPDKRIRELFDALTRYEKRELL